MKKIDRIQAMKAWLLEMKPMILKSGFAQAITLGSNDDEELEKVHNDHVLEGYNWIKAVHETEYKYVMEIRKLLPEETWDRYERWGGFDEHREVVLLKERLAVFKKAMSMKNRPNILKRTKVEKWLHANRNKSKNSRSKKSNS